MANNFIKAAFNGMLALTKKFLFWADVLSPEEQAKKDEIDSKHAAHMRRLDGVSHDAERKAVREPRTKYLQAPTDKNWKTYTDAVQSREAIEREFAEMRSTAKAALREFHVNEVAPFCAPIMLRLADATQRKGDELEAQERAAAESIGVEFYPSETLLAIRSREIQLRTDAEALSQGRGNIYGGCQDNLGQYLG